MSKKIIMKLIEKNEKLSRENGKLEEKIWNMPADPDFEIQPPAEVKKFEMPESAKDVFAILDDNIYQSYDGKFCLYCFGNQNSLDLGHLRKLRADLEEAAR